MARLMTIVGARLYTFVALLYGAAALVVLATDQGLWADGAFFAFVAAQDDPWSLLWRDFPARIGGGLITSLPAWIAGRLGAETTTVALLYQATYLAVPLVFLPWAWRLLPPAEKDWMAAPVLFWAAVAMTTFTFPSELWISAALFWPILFAVRFPAADGARATRLGLAPLLMFTHETVVLLVPVLLWAAWGALPRHRRLEFAAVLVGAAVAMAVTALTADRANPLQAFAVAGNAGHFLAPVAFFKMPLLAGGGAALALLLLTAFAPETRMAENLALLAAVLLAVLAYGMVTSPVFPYGLYLARVGTAVLLPPFAVALLLWRQRLDLSRRRVALFLLPLVVAQAVVHGDINLAWQRYRDALLDTLGDPPARPLIDLTDTAIPALAATPRQEANFLWRWVLPYQSLTLRLPAARSTLIVDQAGWFMPFTCGQIGQLGFRGAAAPEVMPALGNFVCALNP